MVPQRCCHVGFCWFRECLRVLVFCRGFIFSMLKKITPVHEAGKLWPLHAVSVPLSVQMCASLQREWEATLVWFGTKNKGESNNRGVCKVVWKLLEIVLLGSGCVLPLWCVFLSWGMESYLSDGTPTSAPVPPMSCCLSRRQSCLCTRFTKDTKTQMLSNFALIQPKKT